MDINRENYEECFLLYADDELTDSEKAEVLMFVKNNKDLEEEFRMIHHTISKPDMNVSIDKSFLFRSTQLSFINESNYEEVFVLYHDNELTEKEKQETDYFLLAHKELKSEFDLIGLARLTPESSVVFPGKKILYKKEKSGKVVPIILWRMLAAAIFIGFGLWTLSLYFEKPPQKNIVTAHVVPVKHIAPKIEKAISSEQKTTEPVAEISQPTDKNKRDKIKNNELNNQKDQYRSNTVAKNTAVKKSVKEISTRQPSDEISNELLAINNEIKNISGKEILSNAKIDPSAELEKNTAQIPEEKTEADNFAQNASYTTEASNNNQNYVFYDVTTEKFKKTKLGSILKIAKRIVERNNPIARLLAGDNHQVASN